VLELPVTSGEAGERSRTELFEAPENHHLEGTVYGKGVGQPVASEGLSEPDGWLGSAFDHSSDPFVGTAVYQLQTVEVGSVEQSLLVVQSSVVRLVGFRGNLLDGADPFRKPCGKNNFRLGMKNRPGAVVNTGQLHGDEIERIPLFGLAGHDFQFAGLVLFENNTFAYPEVVEAVKTETGIAV